MREMSMKKLIILAILMGLGMCLTVGIIFAAIRTQPKPVSWSTQSPAKTYLVRFSGNASAPSWPFTEPADLRNRKVTIDVSKNGQSIVAQAEVYGGHAYDSDFKELYPDMEWFTENGLHLWDRKDTHDHTGNSPHNNEIVITNESGEVVKYLYLKAGATHLFLMFDLSPDARLNLRTALDHSEDLVGCQGQFSDRVIPYRSADFSRLPVGQSPNRYEVVIQKDGCSVTGKN